MAVQFVRDAGDDLFSLADETELIAGWKHLLWRYYFRIVRSLSSGSSVPINRFKRVSIKVITEIIKYFSKYVYQRALDAVLTDFLTQKPNHINDIYTRKKMGVSDKKP